MTASVSAASRTDFRPGMLRQTWVFAVRESIRAKNDLGQSLVLAVFAPIVFLTCFLVTQRKIMEAQGIDYVQFLPPWVLVQVTLFLGVNAATRVAQDADGGLLRRTRSLPVSSLSPALGRGVVHLGHAVMTIAILVAVALAFGFRFRGDVVDTLVFLVIAAATAMVIHIGFDAVALFVGSPDAVSPVLTLPMLIFSLLSSGLVPAEQFPDWISGFVAHQPVSRIIDALRDLAAGTGGNSVSIAAIWLVVLGAVALAAAGATMRRGR